MESDQEKMGFLFKNCEDFTMADMAAVLEVGVDVIYRVRDRYSLKFKGSETPEPAPEKQKKFHRDPKLTIDAPKKPYIRPPAVYSNSSPMGIASEERHL